MLRAANPEDQGPSRGAEVHVSVRAAVLLLGLLTFATAGASAAPPAPVAAAPATDSAPGAAEPQGAGLQGDPAATPLADPATAILAGVDRANQQAQDASFRLDVVVQVPNEAPRERSLQVWQKGARRLLKFLAPARLRGTGALASGSGSLKLYLPAYQRVRPVVGRAAADPFLGTDFSLDDLTRVEFSQDYVPTLQGETPETWTLDLRPRKPADFDHALLRLRVQRADHGVLQLESFDAQGQPLRRIEMLDRQTVGGYTVATRIVLQDLRHGNRTEARLGELRFDQGLGDDLFSERFLRREP